MKMPSIARAVATVAALYCYTVSMMMLTPWTAKITSEAAGHQLDNDTAGNINAIHTMNMTSALGVLPLFALIGVLLAVWWKPLRRALPSLGGWLTTGVVLLALGHPASAYWDTTDKTEALEIMPNESVFWVPNTGPRDNQVQFDSESYWNDHKVASKLFIVPHTKLANTGGWSGFDSYVPAGRAFIVDRMPYSREWVGSAHRGTSAHDDSFPCQTKEGLNVSTGVSIGASVSENDAAKFLAHFGVRSPQGDRSDPKVIFTSVFYGRSLIDVMDDVGRKKVQTLVCDEFYKRGFDEANASAPAMMDSIRKNAAAYFANVGVTLDFLGWADTWTFDPIVQQAINDRYAAEHVAPALDNLRAKAVIDAVQHWNGTLPTSVSTPWISSNLGEAISNWFTKQSSGK